MKEIRYSSVYARSLKATKSTKDRLLNVEQVRKRLNCSRRHVYNLINEGKLIGFSIGNSNRGKRVTESSVENFINIKIENNLI